MIRDFSLMVSLSFNYFRTSSIFFNNHKRFKNVTNIFIILLKLFNSSN